MRWGASSATRNLNSSNESYGRVYPHSSESALIICQSGFDSPAGGTATLVCYTRPSVETCVPSFSVYAADGKIKSA